MKLSNATLGVIPKAARPRYDRAAHRSGIVHLGIGAFHRAHQAVYADDAMAAGDPDWMITGVSLRSSAVAGALLPQDCLYTVTERDARSEKFRVVPSVKDVIVASRDPGAAIEAMASSQTQLVTLTVTEKGYHRRPDGTLDFGSLDHSDVTIYHLLAHAMLARRAAGLPGFTILCCDNISGNGAALHASIRQYLDRARAELGGWFEAECACPSSMVDRIVPAATEQDLQRAARALGVADAGAVVTEPFRQWIIEDRFVGRRPRFDVGGAEFVSDVKTYETAKLRMLNGAHSALAYLGLAADHDFVHEAIADPGIRSLVETLIRNEAARSFVPAPDQDLGAYGDILLARFMNPALKHSLAQIAQDGSQKIPQRWLASLKAGRDQGRSCPATLLALSAWLLHVRGDHQRVDDPMADALHAMWLRCGHEGIVDALFGAGGIFGHHWQATTSDRAILNHAIQDGAVSIGRRQEA